MGATSSGNAGVLASTAQGASAGSAAGPYGALVGGILGFGMGIAGKKSAKKAQRAELEAQAQAAILARKDKELARIEQQINLLKIEERQNEITAGLEAGTQTSQEQLRTGFADANNLLTDAPLQQFDEQGNVILDTVTGENAQIAQQLQDSGVAQQAQFDQAQSGLTAGFDQSRAGLAGAGQTLQGGADVAQAGLNQLQTDVSGVIQGGSDQALNTLGTGVDTASGIVGTGVTSQQGTLQTGLGQALSQGADFSAQGRAGLNQFADSALNPQSQAFQRNLASSQEALDRSLASRGLLGSGAAVEAQSDLIQSLSDTEQNRQIGLQRDLAGFGANQAGLDAGLISQTAGREASAIGQGSNLQANLASGGSINQANLQADTASQQANLANQLGQTGINVGLQGSQAQADLQLSQAQNDINQALQSGQISQAQADSMMRNAQFQANTATNAVNTQAGFGNELNRTQLQGQTDLQTRRAGLSTELARLTAGQESNLTNQQANALSRTQGLEAGVRSGNQALNQAQSQFEASQALRNQQIQAQRDAEKRAATANAIKSVGSAVVNSGVFDRKPTTFTSPAPTGPDTQNVDFGQPTTFDIPRQPLQPSRVPRPRERPTIQPQPFISPRNSQQGFVPTPLTGNQGFTRPNTLEVNTVPRNNTFLR